MGRTTRIDLECPHCGAKNDMHMDMQDEDSPGPSHDAVTICLYCVGFAFYDFSTDKPFLRKPTREQYLMIVTDPEVQRYLVTLRDAGPLPQSGDNG